MCGGDQTGGRGGLFSTGEVRVRAKVFEFCFRGGFANPLLLSSVVCPSFFSSPYALFVEGLDDWFAIQLVCCIFDLISLFAIVSEQISIFLVAIQFVPKMKRIKNLGAVALLAALMPSVRIAI